MKNNLPRKLASGTLVLAALCLLVRYGATLLGPSNPELSEQCILCHVDVLNRSMTLVDQHPPFFERNCTVCHLRPAGGGLALSTASAGLPQSEPSVPQAMMWRKRNVARSSARKTEHTAALKGLQAKGRYRVRVVTKDKAGEISTPWFGLDMDKVPETGMTLPTGSEQAGIGVPRPYVVSGLLYRVGPTTLVANWTTETPTEGRVEAEELQGLDLTGESTLRAAAAEEVEENAEHPDLNDPVTVAIDICYECHPQSGLGTSHPVRVYARSSKTEVPADLPTVNGMVTCATCHHPHAGPGEKLIRERVKTKVCVACHYGFRGTSRSTLF